MSTLLVAVLSFAGFIVAYHTYGRWLARKIFGLDADAPVPSQQLRDDVDFVPTRKEVIFGHHFTSIAGTGPIVGPAIAVFWGWLPALLWVVFGSIFIGAVHDFGALVVSMRNRGQTVGEVAGRLITPRAKYLFLLILFFALTVVLAVFGLVIANIFALYPESVLPVWISLPIAVAIGYRAYKGSGGILVPSLVALVLVYIAVVVGAYWLPITLPPALTAAVPGGDVMIWTAILFVYCFFASVLPVWVLLQPRDFINSHQLIVALVLLMLGLFVASITGAADLAGSAPMVTSAERRAAAAAPPIWPLLFITIACGAVSGFHCLVSSGTTSKQVAKETDAQYVAYGSMLLEGALAVVVILACCAGVGMGLIERNDTTGDYAYLTTTGEAAADPAGAAAPITGLAAWNLKYPVTRLVDGKEQPGWKTHGLKHSVGAFVEGGANFLAAIGIPLRLGVAIVAVLVASFAATTLDTATRLQRYVTQELAAGMRLQPVTNKYAATTVVVVLAMLVATLPGPRGVPGTGGLILWPLFGATNQLLAGLAFMVTVFYLWRRSKPILFALAPMLMMLMMPAWALLWYMFNSAEGWFWTGEWLLFGFGAAIMALQVWMMLEALLLWPRAKGVLEQALPPLEARPAVRPTLAGVGAKRTS